MGAQRPAEKNKRSLRTRESLERSFIGLIPRKKWDSVTVTELCAAAGITRGTFYQYFDDISDLMENIQSGLLDALRERYISVSLRGRQEGLSESGDFRRHFSEEAPPLFEAWFMFCREHRDAMLALTDVENGDPGFIRRIRDIVLPYLDEMMDGDGLPQDSMRPHFRELLFAMHCQAMRIWLSGNSEASTRRMARLLNSLRVGGAYSWFVENSASERGGGPPDETAAL